MKVDENFILQNCEDQKRRGRTAFEPSYPPPLPPSPNSKIMKSISRNTFCPVAVKPFLQRGGTKGPRIGLARQDRFKAGIVWSQMGLTFRCDRSKASASRAVCFFRYEKRETIAWHLHFEILPRDNGRNYTGAISRTREKYTRFLSLFLLLPNARRVRILRVESSSSLFRPILRRTWLESEMIDGAALLCVPHANLQFFARA